jgi:hypothetical protein
MGIYHNVFARLRDCAIRFPPDLARLRDKAGLASGV